jgi:hypothetical protein
VARIDPALQQHFDGNTAADWWYQTPSDGTKQSTLYFGSVRTSAYVDGATIAMAQNGPLTGGYPPATKNPNLYCYYGGYHHRHYGHHHRYYAYYPRYHHHRHWYRY